MPGKRTHSRREFLKGRSAADAVADWSQAALPDELVLPQVARSPYLVRVGRRAMACDFEVLLNAGQYANGAAQAVDALDLVEQLEAQMTVYRETSEIMHVNRTASEQPAAVEERLFQLLEMAAELARQTGGAFDVTSGPLSKVWGFYRRQGEIPSEDDLLAARARVGWDSLRLDAQQRTVQFLKPGMEINLGSIGKGHALDRAAEHLAAAGVNDFLLHAGRSSMLARGSQAGQGDQDAAWPINVDHPLRPGQPLGEIRLKDRALGTSGSRHQFFRHQGRRYGHVIDPRTGQPADGMISATVTAPTGAEADALATALFTLGPEQAIEYLEQHPSVGGLMILRGDREGDVTVETRGMNGELTLFTSP